MSSKHYSAGIAARLGRLSAAALLVAGTAVGAVSPNWWVDIKNDRVDSVKTELALGEDPNVKSADGEPAIMQAIRDQAWGVYDLLSRHRALDVNITNKNNETPLMYLAIVGDVERSKALIARGAQVNRLGWTPLHYAASKGQVKMVNFLMANKALVDAPSPDGTTPLMMAAFSGSEDTVRALLDAGAEVTTQNLSKLDAADWARNKNFTSLADRLDALIDNTLAQRYGRQGGPAAAVARPVAPIAPQVQAPRAPSAPSPTLASDPNAPTLASDPNQTPEAGSTSRYFDLDRFERQDN
ncbi:ankyrin repeat domain-containing protein [Pusillimonas minor]|uniref:Ankyrin repeat domain-containing protein n=1 Tax=Pusillimonas minor TaxID=2697024 RepID=A0A842HP30_9BURK|nr:ankyrin repeat domain-containing protein [Pusillimonas minor]MBC2769472.1 ankyrin repeat domain-containing protein [Pusillimonas minor]